MKPPFFVQLKNNIEMKKEKEEDGHKDRMAYRCGYRKRIKVSLFSIRHGHQLRVRWTWGRGREEK
jgi:hypothetical protein